MKTSWSQLNISLENHNQFNFWRKVTVQRITSLMIRCWKLRVIFPETLKEWYSVACLECLRETSFHKHSCWRPASISGRQLAGEEWGLAAGAKKLKLKLRGKKPNPRHTCITTKPRVLELSHFQSVGKSQSEAAPPSWSQCLPPHCASLVVISFSGGCLCLFTEVDFLDHSVCQAMC